jgi:hypothetical protein
MESPVPRPLFFGLALAGALGAVLVADSRTSSFLAGFGVGTGAVFVVSFLKNPRGPRGPVPEEGKFGRDDEDPDRRG